MMSELSRNVKDQGHIECDKHIIVDNSVTIFFINMKLVPKYS